MVCKAHFPYHIKFELIEVLFLPIFDCKGLLLGTQIEALERTAAI